jgi:hypothetical protein
MSSSKQRAESREQRAESRRLLTSVLCLLTSVLCLLTPAAPAAHVTFNLTDFTTQPVTNKTLLLTSLSTPRTNGTTVVITDRRAYTTDTNGSVTVSNLVYGNYRCELRADWTFTPFTILVPEDANLYNATEVYVATNSVAGTGVGYTQDAADARFVLKTSGVATNLTLHGFRLNVVHTNGPFSILPSQYVAVLVNATSNTTFTLPATSFVSDGRLYRFKNLTTNTVTLSAASGDRVEAATSLVLSNQYQAVEVMKHSTNWWAQ